MAVRFDEYTFSGMPQLNLDEFNQHVKIIVGSEAAKLRDDFIGHFVDKDSEYYKDRIAKKRSFSDGQYYTGYLWECIKSFKLKRVKELLDELSELKQTVYVFWDLHSSDRIKIKNYWKYPRESILKLKTENLTLGLRHLPEDIYIFDDTFQWSLILTHEHDDSGRLCCKAFPTG